MINLAALYNKMMTKGYRYFDGNISNGNINIDFNTLMLGRGQCFQLVLQPESTDIVHFGNSDELLNATDAEVFNYIDKFPSVPPPKLGIYKINRD